MTEAALKEIEPHVPAPTRRFELADLSQHGAWLLKRFSAKFPDMTDNTIAGYLQGLLYSNEHLFLYQDNAVGLAQLVYSAGIRPVKVVQERFVWIKDRNNKEWCENAADFYSEMQQWGKRQGAERIIACEDSDVPKALIEARIGRLFDTKISHARI